MKIENLDDLDSTLIEKIKYKYWEIVPHNWRLCQVWYRFKCWVWKRYTTIKPRYLDHTWHDRTELLLHINMEILCKFLEKEKPFEVFDFERDEEHKQVKQEMESLYAWWIDCHTNRNKDDVLLDKTFEEYRKVLENFYTSEEKRSWVEPVHNCNAYALKQEFNNEAKYREYVFAHAKLTDMHEKFLNSQIIRVINLREWFWT